MPCGVEDKAVTSLSELLGRNVGISETDEMLIKSFGKIFKAEMNVKSECDREMMLKEILFI